MLTFQSTSSFSIVSIPAAPHVVGRRKSSPTADGHLPPRNEQGAGGEAPQLAATPRDAQESPFGEMDAGGGLPSNLRSCRHLQDRLPRLDLWFCARCTRLCHILPLLQRGLLRLRLPPRPSPPPRPVSILSPHQPAHRSPGLPRSDRSVLQTLLPLLYTMECCEW